jgi:hypothetical protein
MDLGTYVSNIRLELAVAAEAGGDDARALAERLAAPLESAFRLALLDALSDAADEITRDLAPGSVHLRLRGREPGFVVTPAPSEPVDQADSAPAELPPVAAQDDDGAMTRINLRLSENLKGQIDEAADRAGLSVNGWLVRAAAAALDVGTTGATSGANPRPARTARGSQRYTGWVR